MNAILDKPNYITPKSGINFFKNMILFLVDPITNLFQFQELQNMQIASFFFGQLVTLKSNMSL